MTKYFMALMFAGGILCALSNMALWKTEYGDSIGLPLFVVGLIFMVVGSALAIVSRYG